MKFLSSIRRKAIAVNAAALLMAQLHAFAASSSARPNISGQVTDNAGKPLSGVVVSDGKEIALTDSDGRYSITSDKSTGNVWVSIPRGYEAPLSGSRPQFFAYLSDSVSISETHDFKLTPVTDPDDYVLLVFTDTHLAGRRANKDVEQFRSRFVPDFNATVADYRAKGKHVYSVALGDLSWDRFWGDNKFGPAEAARELDALQCTMFPVIGNHDYNPFVSGDHPSEETFRQTFAPTYYSFNLGKVHYVVLDDMVQINNGATPSKIGDREYKTRLDSVQMQWLKADLATLPDPSTPIVICTHVPFYKTPSLLPDGTASVEPALTNTAKIEKILARYPNVKIFAGHQHKAHNLQSPRYPGITQWVYPAVCGTFWWTGAQGRTDNNITQDGLIGGYGVWEVDGTDMSYHYKSAQHPADYQMRIYDLNQVRIDASLITTDNGKRNAADKNRADSPKNTGKKSKAKKKSPAPAKPKIKTKYLKGKVAQFACGYDRPNVANELLINVFSYGPGWNVEATELGRPLTVTRVQACDPLHIISYAIPMLNLGKTPSAPTQSSIHFFKVTASAPDTPVTVTVTDPWGHVFTQTVERPKTFDSSMK